MARAASRSKKPARKASKKTVAKARPKAKKRPAAKGMVDPLPGRDPFGL